jgi:hypothetical protein
VTRERLDGSTLRRMKSALRRDPDAMMRLREAGIEASTIELHGIGLREPYRRADGRLVDRVISYALAVAGGRQRFGCVHLQGATSHPEHPVAWSAGRPLMLEWFTGGDVTIVCGSAMELWQLGQAAERSGGGYRLITSSQPDVAPAEWEAPAFWSGAGRILLTGSVSISIRRTLIDRCSLTVEHSPGVACPDGSAIPPSERHDEWLADLLAGAVRYHPEPIIRPGDVAGDFAADAISVAGGFVNGEMLYPFEVERRHYQAECHAVDQRMTYSLETLVLRADGVVLEARTLPAPKGTPSDRRVHALSDGTRIASPPRVVSPPSFSLKAIKAYIAARSVGEDPCRRSPGDIVADIRRHIAGRVVLPRPADLWVAAAFVVMTHLFRIFDALPILRASGGKGSGKSELGSAVADLSFNARVMGQGSAAALVRLAAECGGLVVIDDAEMLGAASGHGAELVQCLKVGYKQSTGRKPVVLGSGRVQVFDFFGPRMTTAITDADPVLLSRCVTVKTRAANRPMTDFDVPEPDALRDELHALAMSRAREVAESYQAIRARGGCRDDEVRAPLLAIAQAFGIDEVLSALADIE